jgi:hypothetical protein
MTPQIPVIWAGDPETREPGACQVFQHGHRGQSVVEGMLELTEGRRDAKLVKVMSGSGSHGGKQVTVKMTKAVHCACWDGDIVVSVDSNGKLLPEKNQGGGTCR